MLERLLKNKIDVDRVIGSIVRMFLENPYDNRLDNFNEVYKSPSGAVYYSKRGALSYFFTNEGSILDNPSHENYVISKLYYFLTGKTDGIEDSDIEDIETKLRNAIGWYIELYTYNKMNDDSKKEQYRLESNFILEEFLKIWDLSFEKEKKKISRIGQYFILISLLEKKRFDPMFDFLRLPNYFYEEYKSSIDKTPKLVLPLFLYGRKIKYPSLSSDHPEVIGMPSFTKNSILRNADVNVVINHLLRLYISLYDEIEQANDSISNAEQTLEQLTEIFASLENVNINTSEQEMAELEQEVASEQTDNSISSIVEELDSHGNEEDYSFISEKHAFLTYIINRLATRNMELNEDLEDRIFKATKALSIKLEKQANFISRYNKNINKFVDANVIDKQQKEFIKFLIYGSDFFQYVYIHSDNFEDIINGAFAFVEDYMDRVWGGARKLDIVTKTMPYFWLPTIIHKRIEEEGSDKPFKEKLFQKTQRLKRRLRDEER